MRLGFVIVTLLFAGLSLIPGLKGPFVHDDFSNLRLVLVDVVSWQHALDTIFSNGSGLLRRPVSNASFLVNYLLLGDKAFGFKLVNWCLHLACGALIYCVGREVLRIAARKTPTATQDGIALFAAAVWVAHPMNVSTVLYTVQRMTQLSALFSLAAILVVARQLATWTHRQPSVTIGWFYAFTVAAIFSKESGALTPLYCGVIALAAMLGQGDFPTVKRNRSLLLYTVALPMVAGTMIVGINFDKFIAGYSYREFTLSERLATQAVVLWEYLGQIALPLPHKLHFFWDDAVVRQPNDNVVIAAVAGWLAAFFCAAFLARRTALPLFAICWYLAGHAMESSFLPLELAYEHRNYLPMFGPLLAISVGLQKLICRTHVSARTAGLALLASLMAVTGFRALTWSNLPRLASHEVASAPQSPRAHFNALNVALLERDWPNATMHLNTLRTLTDDADWVATAQALAFCYGNPLPLDWQRVRSQLIHGSADPRVARGMTQLTANAASNQCLQPPRMSLDALLQAQAKESQAQGENTLAADYWHMAGSLSWARGDRQEAEMRVLRATRLAPLEAAPLERLLFIQLSSGNITEAKETMRRAEVAWQHEGPLSDYKRKLWAAEIAKQGDHPSPP